MTVHHVTPFRRDKNLAKAYNEAFFNYTKDEEDWICFRDIDTCFLTPNTPNIIEDYIERLPDAGILTCYTNRVGGKLQIYKPDLVRYDGIIQWSQIADRLQHKPMAVTEIKEPISGMLMCISRRTWNQVAFNDSLKCLGVDTDFSIRILSLGLKIYRMDTVLIWHTYRLLNGSKKHLL